MNILLVDDEPLELEAIQATVDLHALGFDRVVTASNTRQAREVLESQTIHVLLCDIEMPQGNGLELLEWVRAHQPGIECVFLTCHADFQYARRAIALGSLDYLLKPVQAADLTAVLNKAIEKRQETDDVQTSRQFSRLWLKHQPLLVERFWLDLLSHRIPPIHEAIRDAATAIGIPGMEDLKSYPVLIRVQRWYESLNARDEKLLEYGLRNIAQEMFLEEEGAGIVLEYRAGCLLVLLYLDGFESMGTERLNQRMQRYVASCHDLLHCDLCCYAGMDAYTFELAAMADRLLVMDRNNVSHKNAVFFLNRKADAIADVPLPNAGIWLPMLEKLEGEPVLAQIDAYFDDLVKRAELNAAVLHQLQHIFMNLIYMFSKSTAVPITSLAQDDASRQLFDNASMTVDGLHAWVSYCIRQLCAMARQQERTQTPVGKVKALIAQHLDTDISCEEIAARVFLNPIYLNRIFKKETGLSLSEYMQMQRLSLAQDLLVDTDLPVSTVAQRVGYTNFSHFSRLFRKHAGCSPVDYRKAHRVAPGR